MSDNAQPTRFPNGLQTKKLTGLEFLIFDRNIIMDTTSQPLLVNPVSGKYKFVVDAGYKLNGLYTIDVAIGTRRVGVVLSISARAITSNDIDGIQNTVNILSVVNDNPDVITLSDVSLFATLDSNSVGAIATFSTTDTTPAVATIEVSTINSTARISSSLSILDYTKPIAQRKYGYHNALEVKDDKQGVNVNLNLITKTSTLFCNPASTSSRPPGTNGIGTCFTVGGAQQNQIASQIFIDSFGDVYSRPKDGTYKNWYRLSSARHFPRLVASGTNFLTLKPTTGVSIPVPNLDLRRDRFVINATPEYVSEIGTKILVRSRANNSFSMIGQNESGGDWSGRVNWAIFEAYDPALEPAYDIALGVWDSINNTLLRPPSVNEGSTIRATIETSNVTTGTNIPYTITGVQQSDITVPLSGYFAINAQGNAFVDIGIIDDKTTDGAKTLKISMTANSNISSSLLINDTSTSPSYNIQVGVWNNTTNSLSKPNSVNEGDSVRAVLTTTNVNDGTSVPYRIVANGFLLASGNFIVSSNRGFVDIGIVENHRTDGTTGEYLLTVSMTNPPALSDSIRVMDTSQSESYDFYWSSDSTGDNRIENIGDGTSVWLQLRTTSVPDNRKFSVNFNGSSPNTNHVDFTPSLPDTIEMTVVGGKASYKITIKPNLLG